MRGRRVLVLLGGLVALALGPVLLRVAPVPEAPAFEDWIFPDTLTVLSSDAGADLHAEVPAPSATQQATLEGHGYRFEFIRFHYTVSRAGDDLVPWFGALYDKRWIRVSSTVRRDGALRLNTLVLEQVATGEKRVLTYGLRVGPFLLTSFNVAKLAQVPAKLLGYNLFEILLLSAECYSDCREAAPLVSRTLTGIIEQNLARTP